MKFEMNERWTFSGFDDVEDNEKTLRVDNRLTRDNNYCCLTNGLANAIVCRTKSDHPISDYA